MLLKDEIGIKDMHNTTAFQHIIMNNIMNLDKCFVLKSMLFEEEVENGYTRLMIAASCLQIEEVVKHIDQVKMQNKFG